MCIVSYFLKTQRRKRTAAKLSERFCAVFSADMFFCKRMKMTIGVYATVIIKSFILNRLGKVYCILILKLPNILFNKIQVKLEENQQLVSLRDFLLPMLMNGQVKVGA